MALGLPAESHRARNDAVSPAVRYARKRLDLTISDIARAVTCCLRPLPRDQATDAIAASWRPAATALCCLSVRSGFDLYLAAVKWPPGSEVLLSAITIPHLAKLVRLHGYVPVGIDVDPGTMTVEPADVAAACGPRTRALVFAQLFGSRTDLTELAGVCAERGIVLIDDRAQCFDGVDRDLGPADVAMYSFGTIKTATCLGGAVLLVADPAVRAGMAELQRHYPVQSSLGVRREGGQGGRAAAGGESGGVRRLHRHSGAGHRRLRPGRAPGQPGFRPTGP